MQGNELATVVLFTAACAALSTLIIAVPGIAAAWWLARGRWPGKSLVETILSLPLFVPPVATGLVLLLLLGRKGPIGGPLETAFGLEIVFTWKAVVIACAVMSFPLLVRTVRTAFEETPLRLEQIARTLGAGEWRVFCTIALPLAARGIIAGLLLAFARALGEFGATVVLAGMIPGRTSTLATSIYHHLQLGQDQQALQLLGISALLAFTAVWGAQLLASGRKAA